MVNGVNTNNNTQTVENKNEVYQGNLNPSYISTNEFEPADGSIGPDSSKISSAGSGSVNSGLAAALNSGSANIEESSNYIPNNDPPAPPLPPPTDTGPTTGAPPVSGPNGSSGAMGVGGDVDSELDDVYNDLINGNFVITDENGFQSLDGAGLEELYRRLLSATNTRLLLMMMMDQQSEVKEMMAESFLEKDYSDLRKKSTWTEVCAKANQKVLKFFQKGIGIMVEQITAHNIARCNELIAEAEDLKGDGWSNYWTSNGDTQDYYEAVAEAKEQFKAAMERTKAALCSVFGGAFNGMTAQIQEEGDAIFAKLANSDAYISYDENGFIDEGYSKQFILDLRNALIGLLNYNRLIVSSAKQKESIQKMTAEAFSGKSKLSERLGSAESAVEGENSHTVGLFDQTCNQVLSIQKISNEVEVIDKEIEKLEDALVATIFANIFEAVAIVAVVVVAICVAVVTWGTTTAAAVAGAVALVALIVGVCAGVAAAVLKYTAAAFADAVDDDYNPSVDTYNPRASARERKNNGTFMDSAEDLEYQEQMLLNQIGMGQIQELGDGMLEVNNSALEALNRQLTGIQNAQRLMTLIMKQAAEKRRMLFRTFSGISGGSAGGDLTTAAMDDILKQSGMQFQALASNLTAYKEAQNIQTQQAHAMEAAATKLWVSIVCAAAAAVIGAFTGGLGGVALTGALVGWAAGQAIGNAIADVVNANRYPTNTETYSPDPNVGIAGRGTGRCGSGVTAALDAMIANIYNDLYINGTCDAGDGNIAVNPAKVQQLQKRLEKIFITIANMQSMMESKSKILKAIWQSMGVVTDESQSMSGMLRANFESEVRSFRFATSMLSEHVEVANRANVAQKEVDKAWTKFGVTVALVAVSACVGGGVGGVIGTQLANIGIQITSLVNGIIDMALSFSSANSGTGDLANLTMPEQEKKPEKKDAKSAEERILDQADAIEANASINGGMVKSIGGGNYAVNSGEMEIGRASVEKANRVREALSDMIAQMGEVKSKMARASGAGNRPNSGSGKMEMISHICNTMASAMLQTQMQGVQSMVSRFNQNNQAERNAELAVINTAIQAVQVMISIGTFADTNSAISAKNQMDSEMATNPKAADNYSPEKTQKINENYKSAVEAQQNAAYTNLALTAVQALLDPIFMTAYDNQSGDYAKQDKGAVESKNKENIAKNQQALGYGDKLDTMEAQTQKTALVSGDFEVDIQLSEMFQNLNTQIFESGKSSTKSLSNSLTSVFDGIQKNDKAKLAVQYDKAKIEMQDKFRDHQQKLAALSAACNKLLPLEQRLETLKLELEKSPNNKVLLDELQTLTEKVAETKQEVGTAQADVLVSNKELGEAAAKALQIAAALNPRLAKTEKDSKNKETSLDEPVTNEALFDDTVSIKEGKLDSFSIEMKVDGKKVNVEVDIDTKGKIEIKIDGKPMTIDQYVAIKEAEVKKKEEAAAVLGKEANEAEMVAAKAEGKAKAIGSKADQVEAKEKRRIATEKREIAQNAKIAAAKQYNPMEDEVVKKVFAHNSQVIVDTKQSVTKFMSDAQNSSAMAAVSEASISTDIAVSSMNKMDKDIEEKLAGRKLEDLNPQEIKDLYKDLYENIFLKNKAELHQIMGEKSRLNTEIVKVKGDNKKIDDMVKEGKISREDGDKMKAENINKLDKLQSELGTVMQREGELRTANREFNRFVGKLLAEYRKKTISADHPKGLDLPAIKPSETRMPVEAAAPKAQTYIAPLAESADAAEPAAAAPTDPDIDMMLKGQVYIEGGKVKLGTGKDTKEIPIEEAKAKIQATLDAADSGQIKLTREQRAKLEGMLSQLNSAAPVADVAEASSSAGAQAAAADKEAPVKTASKDDTIWDKIADSWSKVTFEELVKGAKQVAEDAEQKLLAYGRVVAAQNEKAKKLTSVEQGASVTS